MKYRKLVCLLLALALLLVLAPAAGAEGNLFFVAVNDTIPVTLTSLPYTSGGVVYVPYTAFDARPGGVVTAYNATAQTFVLFTKDSRLVFDLATGETSDENQNTSTQTALFRNGLLYIPLVFCASHFGLKVSMLESQDGYPVLRFTTDSEVYDDSLFIEKAENLIAYRVTQQSSASDPADHPQAHPDAPAQNPADDPQETVPATVYLVFQNVEFMQENADLLADYQLRGTFFLTAEEIRENPDLVRDLYAQGHILGVTAAEDAADLAAALDEANDALDAVLELRTLLALLPDAAEADRLDGYRIFEAKNMLLSVENAVEHPEAAHILLCSGNAAQALSALRAANANIRLLRETAVLS